MRGRGGERELDASEGGSTGRRRHGRPGRAAGTSARVHLRPARSFGVRSLATSEVDVAVGQQDDDSGESCRHRPSDALRAEQTGAPSRRPPPSARRTATPDPLSSSTDMSSQPSTSSAAVDSPSAVVAASGPTSTTTTVSDAPDELVLPNMVPAKPGSDRLFYYAFPPWPHVPGMLRIDQVRLPSSLLVLGELHGELTTDLGGAVRAAGPREPELAGGLVQARAGGRRRRRCRERRLGRRRRGRPVRPRRVRAPVSLPCAPGVRLQELTVVAPPHPQLRRPDGPPQHRALSRPQEGAQAPVRLAQKPQAQGAAPADAPQGHRPDRGPVRARRVGGQRARRDARERAVRRVCLSRPQPAPSAAACTMLTYFDARTPLHLRTTPALLRIQRAAREYASSRVHVINADQPVMQIWANVRRTFPRAPLSALPEADRPAFSLSSSSRSRSSRSGPRPSARSSRTTTSTTTTRTACASPPALERPLAARRADRRHACSPEDGRIMCHSEAGLDDEPEPTSRLLDDMVGTVRMFLSSVYRNRGLHWCVSSSFARDRLLAVLRTDLETKDGAGTTASSTPGRTSSGRSSSTSRRTASSPRQRSCRSSSRSRPCASRRGPRCA